MKAKLVSILAVMCLLAFAAGVPALGASGSGPTVIHAKHDISRPLAEMVRSVSPMHPGGQRIVENERPPQIPGGDIQLKEDKALQTQSLPLVNTIPGLNFDGIGADGVAPPDTNGSVGATQFVQIVNEEYAVYNKSTGAVVLGPTSIDTIWSGFNGACAASNGGDPNVLYDKAAGRWVVAQLSNGFTSYCIAVSTSNDATGSYARYEFDFSPNIPDYPKLGVWPDAYYGTTNTFQNGNTFIGAMPCAYDRASMLTGGPANAICFQQPSSVASLLPSDVDGNTAPPTGEPNFFVELLTTSSLGLFKFHVDFTNPSNSTFTGPTSIPVTSFSEACGGGTCIPQSGTTQQLDSLGDRLMFRLAYRNFGDHEALVVTHSVTAGSSTGARWYEIRSPNGTPTIFQQGTFAPDTSFRWMGSIAMDSSGDMALGYSVSSSSINPAIRYTGRVPSDPPGSMESEVSIIAGTGSQTGGLSRWGDYSSMSIDASDDCTFWYTTEYLKANGSFNWSTRIASFKFGTCGNTTPNFTLTSSPSTQTVIPGNSTTYTETVAPLNGYSNTVNLSVSGCPSNTTCTLNPTSTSPPYPPSTLTVATTASTPLGTFTLTITGTDGTTTHTSNVTLVVSNPDFSISSNPTSNTVAHGGTAHYTETLTSISGFSGSVNLTASGCPPSSTCSFSPNPVSVPANGSATSTFSVATNRRRTPTGTYTITITGTSGSLTHSTMVTLTVTK